MDGILYANVIPLKIKRPKDYVPPLDSKQRFVSSFHCFAHRNIAISKFQTRVLILRLQKCPYSNIPHYPPIKIRTYHVPGIIGTQVEDGPNKIFIGNLPSALQEMEVKEFVSAYGALKAFHLVKDSATGVSKGYAFFSYVDPSVTDDACKGVQKT